MKLLGRTPFRKALASVVIAAALSTVSSLSAQPVQWISSTDGERWAPQPAVPLAASIGAAGPRIEVFADRVQQPIVGFGGCFNELGWEALLALPEAERATVLQRLFSAAGANFSLCRVPIGSSDYARSYYSYDEVPEDFAMDNFNIERDRLLLLPYIKAAQQLRPDLKLWGSPWCPPAWMKVNSHYAMSPGPAGSPSARLPAEKKIANNATAFRMENRYLEAYALYFSKYVQAYQAEGVTISALHVQNEIVYTPHWPSCTWRPEDLAYFIGRYLGPRFQQDAIATEIWLGTVNTSDPNYVRTVLHDPQAASYIKGIGVQWDAKKAIATIHQEFPAMPIIQTESECGNGEKNWKFAEYTWSLMHRYLSNGARAYLYWNMVLDSVGASTWGWKQNMMISVNRGTKEVVYTPEFYLMMHVSHFVLPGAHRVETSGGDDHLAFVNPDGTRVLVVVNRDDRARTVVVQSGGQQFSASLKPRSFNTLTWRP